MRVAYFDSSALVKLGVHERESLALVEFLRQPLECATSAVANVETTRALRRLSVPQTEIDAVLGGFFLVELSDSVLTRASLLTPPVLRTLDAIHLASALAIDEPDLQFVTYDARLAEAVTARGLTLVQPGVSTSLRPARR